MVKKKKKTDDDRAAGGTIISEMRIQVSRWRKNHHGDREDLVRGVFPNPRKEKISEEIRQCIDVEK
jgi:hypothetical protein